MDISRIHNLYFIFIICLISSLFIMKVVLKNTENNRKDFKSVLLLIKFILLIFSLFVILFHILIFLIIFITILIRIFILHMQDNPEYQYVISDSFKIFKNLLFSHYTNSDFNIIISYYIVLLSILFTFWILYNRVFNKNGAYYGKAKGINFTNDKDLKDEDIENEEKHYFWYSIYLLFIISFVIVLLVSKYDNIQFSITLFFISTYFILYMLHINYRIKKRNIKSLIFLILIILLFSLNTYLFNIY